MIVLSLPGIKGDVTVEGYLQWIAIESMSCGYEREAAPDAKTGVSTLGIAPLSPIALGKSLDGSSVHLMGASVGGAVMNGPALIHFLQVGSTSEGAVKPYLEVKLDAPVVASWSLNGTSDDRPTESFSLLYNKIAITYWTMPDGKTYQQAGVKGWDFVNNVAWTG